VNVSCSDLSNYNYCINTATICTTGHPSYPVAMWNEEKIYGYSM
jgi:hypothetical protein